MSDTIVKVPDIGDVDEVEVIEVSVAVGDTIEADQTLIVLESDKASMEIPAPQAGVVKAINVATGDKISEGSNIVTLDTGAGLTPETDEKVDNVQPEVAAAIQESNQKAIVEENQSTVSLEEITVPDLGGASGVEVIEVSVVVGDQINKDDTLVVLESDKASMEIPSPVSGLVKSVVVKLGDKLDEGAAIAELEVVGQSAASKKTVPDVPVTNSQDSNIKSSGIKSNQTSSRDVV